MEGAIRLACAGSLGLTIVLAGACSDFELTQQPGITEPWRRIPSSPPATKPDLMFSGSYGHVPGRVGVDLPSMTATRQTATSLRAETTATCQETSIMHDEVGPTIHQMHVFRQHVSLALPILDVYAEAVRSLSFDASDKVFVPAGAFGIEVSQELLDAIQSRLDVPIDGLVPFVGAWFPNPAFCVVRDAAGEMQTSIYVDRAGAAGVTSCDDPDAFPEYFRWNDALTRFAAREYVPWGDFPWDGNWSPTLGDLFRRPTGNPVSFFYYAMTDTQRLVVVPQAISGFGNVSQARGCGPDRCVELDVGIRFVSPGGVYYDADGTTVDHDVNRYTYLAGKADDHASAFRVRYHSAEDYFWQQIDGQPWTFHTKDRVLERHAALFDGAGCLVAYCAPIPASVADCDWQLDAANAGLSVPSLPFYDDAIAHEVALNPFGLAFDVPAFPSAPDQPWAEFFVVRAGGDPTRSEDLLADGSADFDGAPFVDVIAWGDPEDYAGAEVWRVAPAAIDGNAVLTRERMTGTASPILP